MFQYSTCRQSHSVKWWCDRQNVTSSSLITNMSTPHQCLFSFFPFSTIDNSTPPPLSNPCNLVAIFFGLVHLHQSLLRIFRKLLVGLVHLVKLQDQSPHHLSVSARSLHSISLSTSSARHHWSSPCVGRSPTRVRID